MVTGDPSCLFATEKKCGLFLSETMATSSASAKTQLLLGVQQENRLEWAMGTKKHNYFCYVGNGALVYLWGRTMFQRQVASTNLGRGGALRHSTQPGPRIARRGHAVLLSCQVPLLSGDTVASRLGRSRACWRYSWLLSALQFCFQSFLWGFWNWVPFEKFVCFGFLCARQSLNFSPGRVPSWAGKLRQTWPAAGGQHTGGHWEVTLA